MPSGDFDLTLDELRAVVAWSEACARPTLRLFQDVSDDPRPAAALDAARVFADGQARSRLQRRASTDARRAGTNAPTAAAKHAAFAAAHAAAAAYLHPLANTTQVRHILGSAAEAAHAGELSRDDDPVVGEYLLDAAVRRISPTVLDVLARYPRAPRGRTRVAHLLARLDSLLRDPEPAPKPVTDDGPFFHGTKADLRPGDLLTPGWQSNYGSGRTARHIYLTASDNGAPLAAVLARGEGASRVYRVEPLGTIEDDPNVTDKRFPGNPTRSYRTTAPLRIVEEVVGWEPPAAAFVERIRATTGQLATLGIEAMD